MDNKGDNGINRGQFVHNNPGGIIMYKSKSGIVFGILFFLLLAASFYGVYIFGGMYDAARAEYNEELSKSRMLNQSAQQAISGLTEENMKLRRELDFLQKQIIETKESE